MSCQFDTNLLVEYASGEIDVAGRAEVTAHVARCDRCRLELRFHQDLAADLRALPVPEFPSHLEEILVRSAVQATRSARPELAERARFGFSWTPVLCTAAGLGIVAVLALILTPGSFVNMGGPVDGTVGTGVGQSTQLVNDALRFVSILQDTWSLVTDFLGRFAPAGRVLGSVLSAVGMERWAILGASVLTAILLLWRLTRPGQKRRVGNVRVRSS